MTAEDGSGILLALSRSDRVRRVYYWMLPNVEKFVTAMDGQFQILGRMYINSPTGLELDLSVVGNQLRARQTFRLR
jgi:hypothetical protein